MHNKRTKLRNEYCEHLLHLGTVCSVYAVVLLCVGTSDRRNILYRAHQRGMGSPEYVYIYYTLMPSGERTTTPWLHDEDTMLLPMEEADRRMAFTALKQVRICLPCSYMINFEMFKGVLHPEFFSS